MLFMPYVFVQAKIILNIKVKQTWENKDNAWKCSLNFLLEYSPWDHREIKSLAPAFMHIRLQRAVFFFIWKKIRLDEEGVF